MELVTFNYILEKINIQLIKNWPNFVKQPITPREKLIITLRYLATGSSYQTLSYTFRVGRSTVAEIVKETCHALWDVFQPIHMPQPSKKMFEQIAKDYWDMWNFPNCIGSIDGKHIRIQCPPDSGTMYYNYKKIFSLVLQGVADAKCKFICVEVGGYGKQSDGGTFNASALYQLIKTGNLDIPPDSNLPGSDIFVPHVFLADEAYPLLQNILRPYARRICGKNEEYFNSRLSRARKSIECAFGAISSKWRLLRKPIETDVKSAEIITKAICILNNIIIDMEGFETAMKEGEDFCENNEPLAIHPTNHVYQKIGKNIRDKFRDFICRTQTEQFQEDKL
ncbi:uncharacterized protein LOC128740406 [Sabethes cyaneus]|uniref:uncharacterized protein LOC128740406 n=1 Tax=Sabethes cyaneus TaxID=53552 RepID=UPI00237DE1C1|nr:uncharacterized protein LOC128740406 [Sabethes cyaneus]